MNCFICGSSEVAKRLKAHTKEKLLHCGLPIDRDYCGPCITSAYNGKLKPESDVSKTHTYSVAQINGLKLKCLSILSSGSQPAYQKLLCLKSEVESIRSWSLHVLSDFDKAAKRAQELSAIVNCIHTDLRACETAVSTMISTSYEARRAAANAFTADKDVRESVFKRDGMRCRKCGSTESLSLDHIVSVFDGGADDIRNMQVLCVPCNSSKGSKSEAS